MTATTTIAADPGAFGYALGTLGFDAGVEQPGPYARWTFDHLTAAVRLVSYPDDGERLELIGWEPAAPGRRAAAAGRVMAWKVSIDGSTPQAVALATIAAAVSPEGAQS